MKYALVHDNQIKVGPRDYHTGFFTDYLETINESYSFPFNAPTEALSINENTFLVPVQDPLIPDYHPVTEQLAGPFYDVNTTSITGTYSVVDVPIDSARNKMKEIIAAVRYIKENKVIDVTVQNTTVKVDTSRGSTRDFWTQTFLLMGDNDTKLVKFINGVWLTLTKSDVVAILTEINDTVQTAFNWENEQITLAESNDKSSLNAQYTDIMPRPQQPQLPDGI